MLKLLNFSVVVAAEHHNPTILNADFLARNQIVPDDWGWKRTDDCFSTPPLARVHYENDVSLICEPSRLQVIDASNDLDPAASAVDDIAAAYVRTLPHVRYTGLGVNFKAMIPCGQPSLVLMQRYLKPGPWRDDSQGLEDMGLRLVYATDQGRLRISLDAGEVRSTQDKGELTKAILAGANFHHDLDEDTAVQQVERIVKRKTEYWDRFRNTLSQIMDREGTPST